MISDNNGGLPRYCHPFHGGWDVARMALNIPESKILFVCPLSCARIIKLNALSAGYGDRIYVKALSEEDIVAGDYEKKTVDAAIEILETEEVRPKALIIYVSCIDAMLGNDHKFQTKQVMERFPDVNCFVLKMCPITRFSSDLPLVALMYDMYSALPLEKVPKTKTVAFIGSNLPLGEDNELIRLLTENGYRPLHINGGTYRDFLDVRSSALNICYMPFSMKACEMLKSRYGTDYVKLQLRYDEDYYDQFLREVCEKLEIPVPDLSELRNEAERELKEAASVCDKEIVIDSTATLFPAEMRTLMEKAGFKTGKVFRDNASVKEPDVDSGHILMPGQREYGEMKAGVLAIGEAAGCFEKAEYTAPLFYDNGHFGYDGIKYLAKCIIEALDNKVATNNSDDKALSERNTKKSRHIKKDGLREKALYRVLPPFAPDYGGICEVMYEMGGLILIHDASGCTVNYVHFDEPRFFTEPSCVYCSGLTEIEAVMGDDKIVINKALKAAGMLKPNFIAFVGSSVPMVAGTDFKGIARECEEKAGIPCFGFDANGIRNYITGASKATLEFAKRYIKTGELSEKAASGSLGTENVNLLGLLPMNYGSLDETAKVKALFKNVIASPGFDTKLPDIEKMGLAKKNIVVSAAGLETARFMEKQFGIPYENGVPYTKEFFAGTPVEAAFVYENKEEILVIGEGIDAVSLAKALGGADSLDLFSASSKTGATYSSNDENMIREIGEKYKVIIADGSFEPLFPGAKFIERPTVSMAGSAKPIR